MRFATPSVMAKMAKVEFGGTVRKVPTGWEMEPHEYNETGRRSSVSLFLGPIWGLQRLRSTFSDGVSRDCPKRGGLVSIAVLYREHDEASPDLSDARRARA
jgi:hypothetical protein